MSYNGTVRCGWCYQAGHNKRSCPEYTEILKQRAVAEIANGEGYEGYWGKRYNKRVRAQGLYADGTKMSAEVKDAQKQVRRCQYCNKVGHNRRTCPTLKVDRARWLKDEVTFRKSLAENMRAHGVGVGTLLKTERWSETHAWMVKSIDWHRIQSRGMASGSYLQGERLRSAGLSHYSRTDGLNFPKMGGFNDDSWSNSEVIGPVGASMVVIPENWATEAALADLCKEAFARSRSECFHDNY